MASKEKKYAETNSLDMLQQRLREMMNNYSNSMIGGSCKNFPEYTHQTGIIYGLALAERELLDLDDKSSRRPKRRSTSVAEQVAPERRKA